MIKKTAAVVVTYNRKELLLECIACLLAQKPEAPDVIVIDNHSTDGTKEALRADHILRYGGQPGRRGRLFLRDQGGSAAWVRLYLGDGRRLHAHGNRTVRLFFRG